MRLLKNPRRPTRAQKIVITGKGLNLENWLVARDMKDMLVLVHRHTNTVKVVPK